MKFTTVFKTSKRRFIFYISYILLIFFILYIIQFRKEEFFYPERKTNDIYDSANAKDFIVANYPFPNDFIKNKLTKLLTDSIFQNRILNEEEKIDAIYKYYKKHIFDNHVSGLLKDTQTPWVQLDLMLNQNAQPYCVNYAVTYHMLATLAGLKCRLASLTGNAINHIYTETFIHAKNSWAITDIFYENVLLKIPGKGDVYLNGYNYRENNICMFINELCAQFDQATYKKYYLSEAFQFGYPFSTRNKILRIISPRAETVTAKNQSIYFKYFLIMSSLYTAIGAGILMIFLNLKR